METSPILVRLLQALYIKAVPCTTQHQRKLTLRPQQKSIRKPLRESFWHDHCELCFSKEDLL